MNKSNFSDKLAMNERNTKNKFSKTIVNKFTDKKSFLEINKNGKASESYNTKKTLEDRTSLDFNKTNGKDYKKLGKVGMFMIVKLEIEQTIKTQSKPIVSSSTKTVNLIMNKVQKQLKISRTLTKSQSPQLVNTKPVSRQTEEKQINETLHSPYKIAKDLKYTSKNLKNEKYNQMNTSFMNEGFKRDSSTKKLGKQKSMKNTSSSRNRIGLFQNKEVSYNNTLKQENKCSVNSKLASIQHPKLEKIEINPKTLLELIYILNEISNCKEQTNGNSTRNSFQDLNKIFKSYLDYNTDEELSKNNSATIASFLVREDYLC